MSKSIRWRGEAWFDRARSVKIRGMLSKATGIKEGKVTSALTFIAYDTPWAHVGDSGAECHRYNETYWGEFKCIPRLCRKFCYKVCVRPATVFELYHLHLLQLQLHDLEGWNAKAGLDARWYTSTPYAGFFYTNSLEEGQACYERVHALLRESEHFKQMFYREKVTGKDAITIKKGCTEMQHPGFGGIPSSTWEGHEKEAEWDETEDRLNSMIRDMQADNVQPSWLHNKIIYNWCELAHQIGDPTYRDVLGYDPFEYSEDTYHKKGGDELLLEVDKEVDDLHQTLTSMEAR